MTRVEPLPTAARAQANVKLGAYGERRAARYYIDAGYEVVAQNWRSGRGELDLVVRASGVLVFVEVKTRSSDRYGVPAEAVTPAKQARIRRLAHRFCAETGERAPCLRFDVVSILRGNLDVLEDCF